MRNQIDLRRRHAINLSQEFRAAFAHDHHSVRQRRHLDPSTRRWCAIRFAQNSVQASLRWACADSRSKAKNVAAGPTAENAVLELQADTTSTLLIFKKSAARR